MEYYAVFVDFAGIQHDFHFYCAGGALEALDFARHEVANQAQRLELHPHVIGSSRKIRRPLCRLVRLAVMEDGFWRNLIE